MLGDHAQGRRCIHDAGVNFSIAHHNPDRIVPLTKRNQIVF
jgi:hypothetical protein